MARSSPRPASSLRDKKAIYFAFPFQVSPPELEYQVHNSWVRPNRDQLPGACREWFTIQNLVLSRDAGVNQGRWLDRFDITNGHVYSYVANNYWSTNMKASQEGDITFRYFITSRKDSDHDALAQFDAQTRSVLVGYPFFDWGNVRNERGPRRMPALEGWLFRIEAANAQLTAFKEAEDGNGFILRLGETSGRDGVEENRAPLEVRDGSVGIPLKARRFSTVRLVFAQPLAGKQGP